MYYGNRAITWTEKGDPARALADFNRNVALEPNVAAIFNNRGQFLLQRQEWDKAIADFTEAIRLNPNYAKPHANRAEAWQLKGDLRHSLADIDQAIGIDPRDPLNYARPRRHAALSRRLSACAWRIRPRAGDHAGLHPGFRRALASQSYLANLDYSKSSLETARARIAALGSGAPLPVIPPAPRRANSSTSIPTPNVTAPIVAPDAARASEASQGRRVALVIGNSDYRNTIKLGNPQNDPEAIGASLRNIGFESVTILLNLTRDGLLDALRTFAETARTADWAMIYYAGHGIEVNGVDYLVPVEAKIASERDALTQGVTLAEVTAATKGAQKLKLLLLDACRDNPFLVQAKKPSTSTVVASAVTTRAKAATRSLDQSLGPAKGLSQVKPDSGTLVFFAAKEGQPALDGDGDNSPFAVAMLQRIATPGVEINKVFRWSATT